jgi:hypothetical protein
MVFSAGARASGAAAGNDGEMADALKELATDAVTGETGSSTNLRKGKRAAPVKRPRIRGTERFRRAVDRMMELQTDGIVVALAEKALKGDLPVVKALVEFAEGQKAQAEPTRQKWTGPTAAQELMEDLRLHGEWKGEQEEGFGEVGCGGLELEEKY